MIKTSQVKPHKTPAVDAAKQAVRVDIPSGEPVRVKNASDLSLPKPRV